MSLLVSLLAAVVVFIAGWAVIKRYPTVIVLFAAGLIMIGLAILFGADSILPKNAKTTGLIWFDAIDIIRLAAIKQVAGIGMIIMVAGGFAKYMETIGASGALVHACISPLKALHSPYIVLGLCYLVGAAMVPVVPSHGGMAMLLLTTMYPILSIWEFQKLVQQQQFFVQALSEWGRGQELHYTLLKSQILSLLYILSITNFQWLFQ